MALPARNNLTKLTFIGCALVAVVTLFHSITHATEPKTLAPSDFPELPQEVRKKAESKGCRIPQTFTSTSSHNIIRGSFAGVGSKDWAILCSIKGKSSIFVIWERGQACPSELATKDDKEFLQTIDEKKTLGYSRSLGVATIESILQLQHAHDGPLPKHLDHQGIVDGFAEKGSIIHFCEKGKWLQLTGSD